MADTGIFRINPLQNWQRDAILKAAQVMRDRFGNPPEDEEVRLALEGLLEVLDPARRTIRLEKEMGEATREADIREKTERRQKERRAKDRRKANVGPPPGQSDRRTAERRTNERRAAERRNRK